MSMQTRFISKIAPGAQAAMKSRGILASLTIAQAILESGWGKHAPGNNMFGIKAYGWSGATQLLTTQEYIGGKEITIKDVFRVYNSLAGSIEDHAAFLVKNSRYKNLIGCKDYKTACQLIQADGYATEQDYARQLISLIEEYKLYKYDTLPPLVHIDKANNKIVYGWALGIRRVDLYIDKNICIGSCHELTARPDVAKAYPNYKTEQCGFVFDVFGKIGKGRHTIKVAVKGRDGSTKWAVKNIKI